MVVDIHRIIRINTELSGHYKIVFTATLFNILFEYSIRGINNLVTQPTLLILLFILYFNYFTILEDIITKYRIRDNQLILIGFIYGNLTSIILPGSIYVEPQYMGINWINLIFINIIWLGIIQGILTFYISTRFIQREWNIGILSRKGYIISVIAILIIYLIFRIRAKNPPKTSIEAIITLIILSLVTYYTLKKTQSKKDLYIPYNSHSRLLDIISLTTILTFILSGTLLTYETGWVSIHYINLPALKLITIWTLFVAIFILLYKYIRKKNIPI